MLEDLDKMLQKIFQRIADNFQGLTGLTKYTLQKWAIIVWASLAVVLQVLGFLKGDTDVLFLSLILPLSVTYVAFFIVRQIEAEEREFLESGVIHAPSAFVTRIRPVTAALLLVVLVAGNSWISAFWMVYITYLHFCTVLPRPPGRSKMREWAAKVIRKLTSLLPPVPEPQVTGS